MHVTCATTTTTMQGCSPANSQCTCASSKHATQEEVDWYPSQDS